MSPSRPLVPDDVPSSPSSAWSCSSPGSVAQDHPFPPTPDSCFSSAPTVVSPDDFAFQIDLQLDKVARRPPCKSTTNHPSPWPSVPSPRTDPYSPSEDDTSKTQVLLRNARRRENMYDRFESSPPRSRNAPRVPPDDACDDFAWEAAHSALMNSSDLVDPSHCSLLIHEVSLLVGLAADEDRLLPGDDYPLVRDAPMPDILPLTLTPTKSLAPRKHRNVGPTLPIKASVRVRSSNAFFPSSFDHIDQHANNPSPSLHIEQQSSAAATDLVTPITCHQSATATRPSLSQHRRRGQVFHSESPPSSDTPHQHAMDLDETFSRPRKPPPKPTLDRTANRCSSLDRLERSLQMLEVYAPSNHRKSQSDGRSSGYAVQRKDRCPSLPPPRRLKKQQSSHENVRPDPSHTAHDRLSPSTPTLRPALPRQYVTPQVCPSGIPDDERDITLGSFMDMDIPPPQQASQKRQTSSANKKKMRSLVSVARRLSRGVVAWGKNLAGSTRPSFAAQEMITVQGAGRL